ncbi:MAG TPA: thioesterase domain-containing protein [Candidatus Binataceae bacterium]|nr:thioesterase domain-containing protein [Candidatus Binataceae bacterium]
MKPTSEQPVDRDLNRRLVRKDEPLPNGARRSPISADNPAVALRRRQITEAWLARMRSGSLVELKRGDRRNLFLVHDGDGEVLLYLSLARRLPADMAVFGLEPRRVAGIPLAHSSIEEMAAFYLEAVRRKQPHGPYLLGGMCAGGVIAYEMAAQLEAAGESVALVLLLEASMPQALKRPGLTLDKRLARLRQAIAEHRGSQASWFDRLRTVTVVSARKAGGALRWEITERSARWWTIARFHLMRARLHRGREWPRFLPELSARQIYATAHQRYAPRPVALASVVLVRAQSGEGDDVPYREVYRDESFGWSALVPKLKVIDVEGGHSSMLEERFVDSLANALRPFLDSCG